MIKNFLELDLKDEVIHDGIGMCRHSTVFRNEEIEAPVRFINYTVIPPSGSFGLHSHGNDNEFYIVLSGEGVYEQNGVKTKVKKGDIMMNTPFGTHGITNTGEADMELLVIEAAVVE